MNTTRLAIGFVIGFYYGYLLSKANVSIFSGLGLQFLLAEVLFIGFGATGI